MNSPVTILLVDDEPVLRRATALLLSNLGGAVTAASSIDEAVKLAEARLYDVAIIDLSPAASAAEVLERMRARSLAPRRVIAIGDGALDASAGFAEVLQKPYAFDRLVRAVFGARSVSRRRERRASGVFPRARVTGRTTKRGARALRGRG